MFSSGVKAIACKKKKKKNHSKDRLNSILWIDYRH